MALKQASREAEFFRDLRDLPVRNLPVNQPRGWLIYWQSSASYMLIFASYVQFFAGYVQFFSSYVQIFS